MAEPQRIAIVRLDNLGDHVLGAGVIGALRSRYPHAELVGFVPAALAQLYARCPHLNALVPLPAPASYLGSDQAFAQLLAALQSQRRFELVINPRFAEDYYLAGRICAALAVPGARILGFRQVISPIAGFDPNGCYTELCDAPEDLHAARYAELISAAAVGGPVLAAPTVWFNTEDWLRIAAVFALRERTFAVLGLGASFPYKRPPDAIYRHVLQALRVAEVPVVLAGTDADRPRAHALLSEVPGAGISSCGQLRLFELAALLAHARLYVGPDAGPKHLAAACATPVLEMAWVPANYPRFSRGPGTAGACWSAWQTPTRSVHPPATQFAEAAAGADFQSQPVRGLDALELDRALVELLALSGAATSSLSQITDRYGI